MNSKSGQRLSLEELKGQEEASADYDTAGLSQQGGVAGVAPSGWTSWSGTRRPTQPFCGRFPAGRNCTPPRSSWRHCRGGQLLNGGFGEKIARFYGSSDMKVYNYGLKKEFLDRYDVNEVLKENHLTAEQIVNDVL